MSKGHFDNLRIQLIDIELYFIILSCKIYFQQFKFEDFRTNDEKNSYMI